MKVTVRRTSCEDTELLVSLRMSFLLDQNSPESLGDPELLKESIRQYLVSAMKKDAFAAVVLESEDQAVSCAFLSFGEKPPRRGDVPCRFGTVYNVYTYPEFRRKGYAERVMREILRLAKEQNLGSVDLLASEAGKPLYEKLGFRVPNHTYMRWKV